MEKQIKETRKMLNTSVKEFIRYAERQKKMMQELLASYEKLEFLVTEKGGANEQENE